MPAQALVPTTIRFQPGLLHRLKTLSEERGKTLSELVELSLRHFIEYQEQARIQQMYQGLFDLADLSKHQADTPTQTIDVDEELYGADGAWKGDHA